MFFFVASLSPLPPGSAITMGAMVQVPDVSRITGRCVTRRQLTL